MAAAAAAESGKRAGKAHCNEKGQPTAVTLSPLAPSLPPLSQAGSAKRDIYSSGSDFEATLCPLEGTDGGHHARTIFTASQNLFPLRPCGFLILTVFEFWVGAHSWGGGVRESPLSVGKC
jgi:hypothetical protein